MRTFAGGGISRAPLPLYETQYISIYFLITHCNKFSLCFRVVAEDGFPSLENDMFYDITPSVIPEFS